MNSLIRQVNELLTGQPFEYAVCGGHAIDLFLGYESRSHGDVDIFAYHEDRDEIIRYMQSLGYEVYELIGGLKGHHITDIAVQYRIKNNIFCCKDGCPLVQLTETAEDDVYIIDFLRIGQTEPDFVEFLFNSKTESDFIYSRNKNIAHPLRTAVLHSDGVPYLAPEICLLYKSTDTAREGYQQDYELAVKAMNHEQCKWLNGALALAYPEGHPWMM